MELERLAITLRPRNAWEALDLGLRFAMQNARGLYANWFAVTLPVAALAFACLGFGLGQPAWAVFLLWWLKPAFDRMAVHVLSRAVFGEATELRDTLKALPRLLFSTRLIRNLTIGRFSMCRSILLPIDVLEGLRGKAARQRKALIARRISGAASWQTLAWMHLETVFWLGFWALTAMLIPRELLPDFEWSDLIVGGKLPEWLYWCIYAPLWLASLLLEPLYAAGGFMLYLKRRTDLEAWDVELQFRHLAQAHAATALKAVASVLCGLCLVTLLALDAPPAQASETAELREQASERAPEVLKKVLLQPEFGKDDTDYKLRWRSDNKKSSGWRPPEWLKGWFEALGDALSTLGDFLALIGRAGGWAMIAVVVILLAWLVSRFGWRAGTRQRAPLAELAGFDIRPQSLPDDIPAAAQALLRAGDTRAALSLLFRGSLSRLAHQEHVPFTRGDTEGDCLTRVREHAPARSAFLARLLGCWQRLAYAHQTIAASEVDSICQEWWREFGRGAPRA